MPDTLDLLPALRPGERMLYGAVYVFDEDIRRDYDAALQITNAPDDLSALSADEITGLLYASIRVSNFTGRAVSHVGRFEDARKLAR